MVAAVGVVWRSQRLPFLYLIDQWRAIDRELKLGPWALESLLQAKVATADQVRTTLRVGLVGGGMPIEDAEKLVEQNCDAAKGQLDEAILVAVQAVGGSLHGLEEDIVGESDAADG